MKSNHGVLCATRRRICGAGITLALAPHVPSLAQARPARVGILSFGGPPAPGRPDPEAPFHAALRDLGYAEGTTIVFERR
jgi:hypothetical protein